MAHSRRHFLKTGLGTTALVSLAPTVPDFLVRAASAAAADRSDRDTVLVVVQLAGGNDGLNMVVPYQDDQYGRRRNTLRLKPGEVHKMDDGLGLHGEMKALYRLYREGQMSIVQGVGYPNSDRSHGAAMRDWHTARPGEAACQTGWVGRAADAAVDAGADVPAAFLGEIQKPLALNGQRAIVPNLRSADAWTLPANAPAAPIFRASNNPLVQFLQTKTAAAYETSRRVAAASKGVAADYPNLQLAGRLHTIAQIIRAEVGIRIFFTELGGPEPGGFDTHAGQRDNHAALLRQLSDSLAAFAADLSRDKSLDRVMLMTFSEFGRTLSENGRRGTGHGAAAPVLLVGGRLKPGLHGRHPSLSDLAEDAPKPHTDFRRLYATALESWLGFDSATVLGGKFKPLEVV